MIHDQQMYIERLTNDAKDSKVCQSASSIGINFTSLINELSCTQ
jgi:hypothetical protein